MDALVFVAPPDPKRHPELAPGTRVARVRSAKLMPGGMTVLVVLYVETETAEAQRERKIREDVKP